MFGDCCPTRDARIEDCSLPLPPLGTQSSAASNLGEGVFQSKESHSHPLSEVHLKKLLYLLQNIKNPEMAATQKMPWKKAVSGPKHPWALYDLHNKHWVWLLGFHKKYIVIILEEPNAKLWIPTPKLNTSRDCSHTEGASSKCSSKESFCWPYLPCAAYNLNHETWG